MVSRLCALGDRVEYRRFEGLDHNTLIAGSHDVIRDWIAKRFAHKPAPTNCGSPP